MKALPKAHRSKMEGHGVDEKPTMVTKGRFLGVGDTVHSTTRSNKMKRHPGRKTGRSY